MHNERTILAGFGGQGIMTMGQLLAQAGLDEGREVSWLPSYGPEMRGGTANCDVIIDDAPVASPVIHRDASSAIIMNLPSMKFVAELVPGGSVLVNSSLIEDEVDRDDVHAFYVPSGQLATEAGNLRTENMVMLGAWCEMTGCVSAQSVLHAMEVKLGVKKAHLMDVNRRAFALGEAAVRQQKDAVAAV